MRETLASFPRAADAMLIIDRLYTDYLRAHKRNLTVDLLFSTTGSGNARSPYTYSVTVKAEQPEAQAAEVEWLRRAASTLTPLAR